MCGSGVMSWVRNQRMATRRFSSSVRNRSAHSACRSAGQSAFSTSEPKYSACRRSTSARSALAARRSAANSRTASSMRNLGPASVASTLHEAVPGECIEQIERRVFRDDRRPARPPRRSTRRRRPTGWRACAARRHRAARRSTRPSLAACAGARGGRPGRARGVEAAAEPGEQRTWFEQPGAGRGQLDGERQTVEAPTDLHDGQGVVVGQGEVVADGLGAIDEQLHRGQRGQLPQWRPLRERRHRQCADRVLPLGPEPKHRPARREDHEAGAAGKELVELGGHVHDLFEVVEHEQAWRLGEVLDHRVDRQTSALDGHAHGGGDARQHQRPAARSRRAGRTPSAAGRVHRVARPPRSPAASCRRRRGR